MSIVSWKGFGLSDPLSPRRLVRTLAIIAIAVVVCWAVYEARKAVLLIYVSGLLAIGLAPMVRLIEHLRMMPFGIRRIPRWLAILALYVLFLAIVGGILLMIVPPIVTQAGDLWKSLPAWLDKWQAVLVQRGLISHRITLSEAVAQAPEGGGSAVATVLATVSGVVGGIIGLVTLLILTFYFLVEADSLFGTFLRLFPREDRLRASVAARQVSHKISAWLGGHLILAAVMGTLTAAGLFLMGVPYAYVVAVIAAVGELVPILGPLIAGTVAVAIASTVSMKVALGALGYFFVLHQLEANVLVPKIMERQVGLSPVGVVVALMVGSELYGFVGAILAVPTTAILKVLLEELVEGPDALVSRRADAGAGTEDQ